MAKHDTEIAKQDARRRKTEEAREAKDKTFVWRGFVNLSLTEQQKSAFNAWEQDGDMTQDALLDAVERVGKVTLSWDDRQGCYMAALTVTRQGRPDSGFCVTARSLDLFRAVNRLLFLYWKVAEGNLAPHAASGGSSYTDDAW